MPSQLPLFLVIDIVIEAIYIRLYVTFDWILVAVLFICIQRYLSNVAAEKKNDLHPLYTLSKWLDMFVSCVCVCVLPCTEQAGVTACRWSISNCTRVTSNIRAVETLCVNVVSPHCVRLSANFLEWPRWIFSPQFATFQASAGAIPTSSGHV